MNERRHLRWTLGVVSLLAWAGPAAAWTPATQGVIAREAARLTPPDLARQIEKHRRVSDGGGQAPFSDTAPPRHMKNPDGAGKLDRVIAEEAEAALKAIRARK